MSPRICPVSGCGATLRSGHLMCRSCWYLVPHFIRVSVNRTWRLFRDCLYDRDAKRADYDRAVQQAIAAAEERR
jgi:hypothetical protein